MVNAFHGYSHNYQCQRKNHPTVVEGVGIEDFETMERIFSLSNSLATVFRYASAYRRGLLIDAYFRQWDDDKYANLGTFLLNNYRQALDVLDHDSRSLTEAMERYQLTDADLDRWEQEETEFFMQLGEEPQANLLQVEYVELLQNLQVAATKKANTTDSLYDRLEFVQENPEPTAAGYSKAVSVTNQAES